MGGGPMPLIAQRKGTPVVTNPKVGLKTTTTAVPGQTAGVKSVGSGSVSLPSTGSGQIRSGGTQNTTDGPVQGPPLPPPPEPFTRPGGITCPPGWLVWTQFDPPWCIQNGSINLPGAAWDEYYGGGFDLAEFLRYVAERAAIVPQLLVENPHATLQALGTYFGGSPAALGGVGSLTGGNRPIPRGAAIASLIGTAVFGVIALYEQYQQEQVTQWQEFGENVYPSVITPRGEKDWSHVAKKLGIDRNRLREVLHKCKKSATLKGDDDVEVDDETGDLWVGDEYIGNLIEGC